MDKRIAKYCTGCGLCESEKKAVLIKTTDGFKIPKSGDEEWLKNVCPAMAIQESKRDIRKIWGREKAVYLGWSMDASLRKKASSGGILTELACFLLDNKKVDCIIHTCASKENPTQTEICNSYNSEEVRSRCGSRYAISHPLAELSKLRPGMTYAFVGKPCDVVALKNYMRFNPELEDKIPYTMSFFCMGLPSEKAQKNLLMKLGCKESECIKLSYRGNGWPGYTVATDKSGREYKMDYDTAWGQILGRDLMPSCRFCVDGIGEMADIACGDAWYLTSQGKPDFSEHNGRNVIFARTEKGLKLINEAQEEQRIEIEEYSDYEENLAKIQKSQYDRRVSMMARIMALRMMGKPHPAYSYNILREYSSHLAIKKQLRIFLGTCKRIIEGKI